ncbi:MAG: hypothetical protein EA397_02185 [Deltaproteobacteria bacterium]|nr:MAG: hypothetical protein EA397_02185 [Deltaproteobacteria bacterium]
MSGQRPFPELESALRRQVRFSIWIWWSLPLPLFVLYVTAVFVFGGAGVLGTGPLVILELFVDPQNIDVDWVEQFLGLLGFLTLMLSGMLGAIVGLVAIPASLRVAATAMRWDRLSRNQGVESASLAFIARVLLLGALLSISSLLLILGGVGLLWMES